MVSTYSFVEAVYDEETESYDTNVVKQLTWPELLAMKTESWVDNYSPHYDQDTSPLDIAVTPTHDELKEKICRLAGIIPDCFDVVLIDLRPVSTTTWPPLGTATKCLDRESDIKPFTEFDGGEQNEMMLVCACVIVDPFFKFSEFALDLPKHDSSGSHALISVSAFVNEPN